jgi:hypothetical protein
MDLYIEHIKNTLKETKKINLSEVTITDRDLFFINETARKDEKLFQIGDE